MKDELSGSPAHLRPPARRPQPGCSESWRPPPWPPARGSAGTGCCSHRRKARTTGRRRWPAHSQCRCAWEAGRGGHVSGASGRSARGRVCQPGSAYWGLGSAGRAHAAVLCGAALRAKEGFPRSARAGLYVLICPRRVISSRHAHTAAAAHLAWADSWLCSWATGLSAARAASLPAASSAAKPSTRAWKGEKRAQVQRVSAGPSSAGAGREAPTCRPTSTPSPPSAELQLTANDLPSPSCQPSPCQISAASPPAPGGSAPPRPRHQTRQPAGFPCCRKRSRRPVGQ